MDTPINSRGTVSQITSDRRRELNNSTVNTNISSSARGSPPKAPLSERWEFSYSPPQSRLYPEGSGMLSTAGLIRSNNCSAVWPLNLSKLAITVRVRCRSLRRIRASLQCSSTWLTTCWMGT